MAALFSAWRGERPGRGLWGLKHSWWVLICLLYILSPLDAIPDFIPVLGQMDDLGVLGFLLYNLVQWFRNSGSPAGEVAVGVVDAPSRMPQTFEVHVTDQTGYEHWITVQAIGPDEARRTLAAAGRYKIVGRARPRS
jgi:hypothetical protein